MAIKRQENALEEQEERAAAQAQEAIARVAYLQKQYYFLYKRKIEIVYYSLCFLDKLDAIKAIELEARNYKVPAPISNVLDLPNILGLDNFNFDPAFQKSLGFSSRTL